MKRLSRVDWEAVAGIVAAVAALVLHILHVVELDVLIAVVLVILAIMLLQNLKRDAREEDLYDSSQRTERLLSEVQASVRRPDLTLVGPRGLREETRRFGSQGGGQMIWFNVCLLMFQPQRLFDDMLKPAIENPSVTSIEFVLDEGERERWRTDVVPKVLACKDWQKVQEPCWVDLREAVSFVTRMTPDGEGVEAQLSFWGEPFMSHARGRDVPRYIFHIYPQSDLIPRLLDIAREHRIGHEVTPLRT